jgi:hypothetical protein
MYYSAFVDRWPGRLLTALTLVADSGSGDVLVHCGRGRDRTGLVSAALLFLVGWPLRLVEADYSMSDPVVSRRDQRRITSLYARQSSSVGRALYELRRALAETSPGTRRTLSRLGNIIRANFRYGDVDPHLLPLGTEAP